MVLLLALVLPFDNAFAADEAAIKAEIEAVRKATIERYKDRLPDNFEDYVRDTGRRNYHRREFNVALTNGNAAALAIVFKEFPEFARAQFLNGYVMQNKSALHYAVERGHREVVELLLAQKIGADAPRPASTSPFGGGPFGPPGMRSPPGYLERRDTPLHAAVKAGDTNLAKLLLDAGANLEALDARSESPLYICVRQLGGPGNTYGTLPAGSDARARQEVMVTLLLRHGAQVFSTNRSYLPNQPLTAVLQWRNEALLDQFLTNCVHRAATNGSGDSLVHFAVTQGRTNALKALLDGRASFTNVNLGGLTPLRQAAMLPVLAQMPTPSYYGSGYSTVDSAGRADFLRQRSADLLLAAGAEADAFALAGLNRTNELAALLRRAPAQASARDPLGRSPLHYAVNAGSLAALQLLLAAKAETEARDRFGQTPLLQAAASRRFSEATHLLAAGAAARATNATGQTALHLAVGGGDTNLFAALAAAGADLNARDAAGKTALELAAVSQRFDLVQWFEVRGATTAPKAARLMTTPLHQAVAQANLPQLLNLLTNGADVNARNELGQTPLAIAVAIGRADLVLTLLTYGANVNLPDTNGITPLRARFFGASDPVPEPVPKPGFSKRAPAPATAKPTATRADSLPPELRPPALAGQPPLNNLLLLLLENGADPKIPDAKGNTILHALQPPPPDYNHPPRPKTALIPEATARIRLLASYGLTPDTRATNGLTPLHAVVAQANLVQTFALLEAGAGINTPDRQGRTVLHHVLTPQMNPYRWQHEQETRKSLTNTLALLLDNGADLRRADTHGATPLHLLPAMDEALRELVLPVLKTSRHFAAAVNLKNKAGQTPVLLAFEQLRAKPVSPVAKVLTTLLDSGGELPPITEQAGTTLLHELAGIGVVGHPFFGASQPDATATEAVTRLASKVVAKAANLDVRNAKGETPLHVAARAQNPGFAAVLLARGANPNAQDAAGDTPLHLALRGIGPGPGGNSVIPLLVSHQCDLGRRNLAGESPLRLEVSRRFYFTPLFLPPGATNSFFQAARSGDFPSLDAYLNLDATLATLADPTTQVSALRSAALAGQNEMAERMRNAGATDPVSAALLGWTNSLAVLVHETPRIAETNFAFGMPLLHLAASRGQTAAVQLLLTGPVPPGLEDAFGRTALYHATTNGNPGLVAWLTARGVRRSLFDAIALADPVRLEAVLAAGPGRANETNRMALPALLVATDLGNLDIVRRLLAHGANPNLGYASSARFFPSRFSGGTVPLHLAAWSNRLDLAEALVAAKAGLSAANERGYTALHFATARGHREMAAWLLARGADANAQSAITNPPRTFPPMNPYQVSSGWTPLHLAVRFDHPALIELLVANGGKLTATDAQGRTPADFTLRQMEMMMSPWAPSPYSAVSSPPGTGGSRDPARTQAVVETLKKLGAVVPTTQGATFINRGLPPGFPGQPGFPVPPPGVPPAPRR